MSGRKQIGKKQRFEVFKRDGFTCQYCGATPPSVLLHVDHIDPVALGGENDEDNLITSCEHCNLGKGARPLSAVPKGLAERAQEVEEREAQIAGYSSIMDAARERVEDDAWRVAEVLRPGASDGYPIAKLNSIKKFVQSLGVHEVLDAADIATSRRPYSEAQAFKYFCGVCWNKIKRGNDG